jgi:hypothetical protein
MAPEVPEKVGFLTYTRYHGKPAGSTKIRALNLIKYWPNAEEFVSGQRYGAVIFQKTYWVEFARLYRGVKILDICDPDWLSGGNVREMAEAVDGITCPTEALAQVLRQFGKPVRVIADRHDLAEMKEHKTHQGRAQRVIWYGFAHNFRTLKEARVIPHLERLGLDITIISNQPLKLIEGYGAHKSPVKEKFVKYAEEEWKNNREMLQADIALLPKSTHLEDRFKSDNRKSRCWLLGLPVAEKLPELEALMEGEFRSQMAEQLRDAARITYDCQKSVQEMQAFIHELTELRHATERVLVH